jgi:hypothetical protein
MVSDGDTIMEWLKSEYPEKAAKWDKWNSVFCDDDVDTVGDLRALSAEDFAGLKLSALARTAARQLRGRLY